MIGWSIGFPKRNLSGLFVQKLKSVRHLDQRLLIIRDRHKFVDMTAADRQKWFIFHLR